MIYVSIDTNVLVSAMLPSQPGEPGKPAQVLDLVWARKIRPVFCQKMLDEYRDVLSRPKFGLKPEHVQRFMDYFTKFGRKIEPLKSTASFRHEADRIFYDTAKTCGAVLITGNLKHYPNENFVVTPSDFLVEHAALLQLQP